MRAVLGLIPATKMLFSLVFLFGHPSWLHALTAVGAAYCGWLRNRKAEDIGILSKEISIKSKKYENGFDKTVNLQNMFLPSFFLTNLIFGQV